MTLEIETSLEAFRRGEVGLYPGIPFDEYLRSPLMSQSLLKEGVDPDGSMLHLKHAMEHDSREPTDAMRLGSALHCAFLEPAEMPLRVVAWTQGTRTGKNWKLFKEIHNDKVVLTALQYSKLLGMLAALRADPDVREWKQRIEHVEISAVGVVQGLKFRCRSDALTDAPLWDLKMVTDTTDRTIEKRIFEFGYDIQGYVYCTVFKRDRFALGFVEQDPPHDVRVVELSPEWLRIGKSRTSMVIQKIKQCMKSGVWPGRSLRTPGQMEVHEPPQWVERASGIADSVTIGGASAFKE